jgi:uncharacterized damage-inducible protein DinB
MTPEYLILLVDFHYWATGRVLDAVTPLTPDQYERDLQSSFKSVRDTLVHLYSAEWVWYQRWLGGAPMAHVTPEQMPNLDVLRQAWSVHEAKLRSFVESRGEAGVEQHYTYTLFNGGTSTSPFWQMLTHLVNHGTYHRGQITTMLRQLGAPPQSIDLIAYYRERAPKA